VLLVHGAFVNSHLWDGVIAALAASGEPLDLIAPDLPLGAHHRPMDEGADLRFQGIVEMLISVLGSLGVDQVIVAANDSGGAITQHMLATHPTRFAGVLLTSTETSDNFPPTYFRFLFPPLRLRSLMWSTCQLLRTDVGRRLPITFGHLIKRGLTAEEARTLMGPVWQSPGARNDLRRFLMTLDPPLMKAAEAEFATITAPVDVAWTANDRIFPDADASRLATSFPNGRRVADITDSGSLSPLDQPQQVASRLVALVERTKARERA
jgi:pimeloyl-ACP methyl ester carboxylesterase